MPGLSDGDPPDEGIGTVGGAPEERITFFCPHCQHVGQPSLTVRPAGIDGTDSAGSELSRP